MESTFSLETPLMSHLTPCLKFNQHSRTFLVKPIQKCPIEEERKGLFLEIRKDGVARNEKDRAVHNLHKGQNVWIQILPSLSLQPFSP